MISTLLILVYCFVLFLTFCTNTNSAVVPRSFHWLRGGVTPAAENPDKFFSQFDLDYGVVDDRRQPGFLRGFFPAGKLSELPSNDPFIRWLYEHVEKGLNHVDKRKRFNRPKAYYATDFGTKADLRKGENPKLIIVNHKLKGDANGNLLIGPESFDVEVRELWQPWLKMKCNFAVRYVVPNRDSILKLLEKTGQFRAELVKDTQESFDAPNPVRIEMTFKPTLLQRMRGMKTMVLKHYIPHTNSKQVSSR